MVAVIIVGRDERLHRTEYLAPDAQRFQPPGVIARQGRELAGAVVHHPDIHSRCGLAGQHFQHPAPEQPLIDDKVFDEDVLFCRFQLAQQFLELGLAAGEVGHGGVLIHREAAAPPIQIGRQRRRAGFGRFQLLDDRLVLRQLGAQHIFQFQQPFAQDVVAEVALHIEEQRHTHHREERNDHHPGDLCTVVHLAVQQVEDHGRRDGHTAAEVVGPQIAEPAEDADQQPHLK